MLSVCNFSLSDGGARTLRWLQGSHILYTALTDMNRAIEHIRARIHQVAHLGDILLLLDRLQVLHLWCRNVSSAPGR